MKEIICEIRDLKPVVHCITNPVTVNDCANIILAVGGSPIMAHHIMEVEEVTSSANALVCNFGATDNYDSFMAAGKIAQKLGHPIIIDPVGVTCSTYRRQACRRFISEIGATCVRGNYEEILSLINDQNIGRGLDVVMERKGDCDEQIKSFARENQLIFVISGKTDYITDGEQVFEINGGDPMMKQITGSGCMFSSLLGAFLCVRKTAEQAASCSRLYGLAAQRAAQKTRAVAGGTMTFRMLLIDELSKM